MSEIKRRYSRRELLVITGNDGGALSGYCVLCGASDWIDKIVHKADCVFADAAITHVAVIKSTVVVRFIRHYRNRWVWAASSGRRYYIEKRGCYYIMYDDPGNEVLVRPRLRDIRVHLKLNQGEY